MKLLIIVLVLVCLPIAFAQTPPDSLVGHFKLNTGSGAVAVNNIAGKADGSLDTYVWQAGKTGTGSINLTVGNADFLVPDSVNWDKDDQLTLAMWMNVPSALDGENWGVFGKYGSLIGPGYLYSYMQKSDGILRYGVLAEWTTGVGWIYDEWHHIVYTVNTTDQCIWIDGSATCRGTGAPINTDNDAFWIGSLTGGVNPCLKCSYDDVRMYNRSLGTAEISAIYNSGTGDEEAGYTGGGDTTPPEMVASEYNVSSEIPNCVIWRTNISKQCNLTDSTPTVRGKTDENSNCCISTSDLNYTSCANLGGYCSTTGSLEQVCTLPTNQSVSSETDFVYLGCQDTAGNENETSTSGPLAVNLTTNICDPPLTTQTWIIPGTCEICTSDFQHHLSTYGATHRLIGTRILRGC